MILFYVAHFLFNIFRFCIFSLVILSHFLAVLCAVSDQPLSPCMSSSLCAVARCPSYPEAFCVVDVCHCSVYFIDPIDGETVDCNRGRRCGGWYTKPFFTG